jgi:hypothetical protein
VTTTATLLLRTCAWLFVGTTASRFSNVLRAWMSEWVSTVAVTGTSGSDFGVGLRGQTERFLAGEDNSHFGTPIFLDKTPTWELANSFLTRHPATSF